MPAKEAGTYQHPVKYGRFQDVREITCEASPALATYTCRVDAATGESTFAIAKSVGINREALPVMPGENVTLGYALETRPVAVVPLAPGTACRIKRGESFLLCERRTSKMRVPTR